MGQFYKLTKVIELSDNDQEFIKVLVETFVKEVSEDVEQLKVFVEAKDYENTYQIAHKMKSTVDLFELDALKTLIEVQDWGKFTQTDVDVTEKFDFVYTTIKKALTEVKSDFNL